MRGPGSGPTDARLPALGPGREFDRIREFLGQGTEPGPGIRVGPGDDAAVLDDGLVISTDLAVEGIHFHLDWISSREAGYRAAMGALSDLAAVAADPLGCLASVATPEGHQGRTGARELMAGLREALEEIGIPLLGGDLTRSPGPMLVDVVVLGRAHRPLLRSGARPGDELWVTGSLGGAAGAVAFWAAGGQPPAPLRETFVAPHPRIREARFLVDAGARAGLDLSDGLAGDAGHLAAASGVGVELEADAIPLHPTLLADPAPPGTTPLELALHGGEDYELLVALPPDVLAPRVEEFAELFDLSVTRVGRVREGTGVVLVSPGGGAPRPLARGGFDHFQGKGES